MVPRPAVKPSRGPKQRGTFWTLSAFGGVNRGFYDREMVYLNTLWSAIDYSAQFRRLLGASKSVSTP